MAIKDGIHLTPKGFLQILHLCYFMNGTTIRTIDSMNKIIDSINNKFPNTSFNDEALKDPLIIDFDCVDMSTINEIPLDYISGLYDGDGTLGFVFPSGHRSINSIFTVILHISDYSILLELQKLYGCGYIELYPSGNAARLSVRKLAHLVENIKPILDGMHFNTVKQEYVSPTYKAWEIMRTEGTNSDNGFLSVIELVYDMNNGGVSRKMSKSAYISMIMAKKNNQIKE